MVTAVLETVVFDLGEGIHLTLRFLPEGLGLCLCNGPITVVL